MIGSGSPIRGVTAHRNDGDMDARTKPITPKDGRSLGGFGVGAPRPVSRKRLGGPGWSTRSLVGLTIVPSRPNADNVYYVRSRVMSSQVGTGEASAEPVTPLSYDATLPIYPDRLRMLAGTRHHRQQLDAAGLESEGRVWGPGGRGTDWGACGAPVAVDPTEAPVSENLDRFYADLLHELGEFARRSTATAIGAAVVVKRVAQAHGVKMADRLPLPRFSRAEREERSDDQWRGAQ